MAGCPPRRAPVSGPCYRPRCVGCHESLTVESSQALSPSSVRVCGGVSRPRVPARPRPGPRFVRLARAELPASRAAAALAANRAGGAIKGGEQRGRAIRVESWGRRAAWPGRRGRRGWGEGERGPESGPARPPRAPWRAAADPRRAPRWRAAGPRKTAPPRVGMARAGAAAERRPAKSGGATTAPIAWLAGHCARAPRRRSPKLLFPRLAHPLGHGDVLNTPGTARSRLVLEPGPAVCPTPVPPLPGGEMVEAPRGDTLHVGQPLGREPHEGCPLRPRTPAPSGPAPHPPTRYARPPQLALHRPPPHRAPPSKTPCNWTHYANGTLGSVNTIARH